MSDIVDLVEGGPPFARNERAVVVVSDAAEPELDFSFRDRSTERFIGLDGWTGEPVFHPGRRVTLPDGRSGYSVGSAVTQHLRLSGAFRVETRTGLGAEIVSRVATFYATKAAVGIGFDAPLPASPKPVLPASPKPVLPASPKPVLPASPKPVLPAEPPRAPADRPDVDRAPPPPSPKPAAPAEPLPPPPAPSAPPIPEQPKAVAIPEPLPLPLPPPPPPPDLPVAPRPVPPPVLEPAPAEPAPLPEPPRALQPLPIAEPEPPQPEAEPAPAPLHPLEPLPLPTPAPGLVRLPPTPPIAPIVPPPSGRTGLKVALIALALLLVAGGAVGYRFKVDADADEALFQGAVACYRQTNACGAPGCFAEYQGAYPSGRHALDVISILQRAQSECRPVVRPAPQPPQPQPPPAATYYYIANLRNTNGDDSWLALRSEPRRDRLNYDVAFSRANMRNGTLLIYLGQQSDFFKVRLLTGQEGWASSQFILCCHTP